MPTTHVQPAEAPRGAVRLSRALWDKLARLARRNGRSRNTEICAALTAHVHGKKSS